jgi:hypothetical protein
MDPVMIGVRWANKSCSSQANTSTNNGVTTDNTNKPALWQRGLSQRLIKMKQAHRKILFIKNKKLKLSYRTK